MRAQDIFGIVAIFKRILRIIIQAKIDVKFIRGLNVLNA